jgi:ABC-type multidrug transport system fused ATPase/permease subunit
MALNQPSVPESPEDRVLLSAWATMVAYDQSAVKLKQQFISTRRLVIVSTVVTTILAALSGLFVALKVEPLIAVVCALASAVTAGITGFLKEDVNEFFKTTTWINLRYIAECIRPELYLYRMEAGIYRGKTAEEADNLLIEKIGEIQTTVTKKEPGLMSVEDYTDAAKQRAALIQAKQITSQARVVRKLTLDDYQKIRVDYQKTWYDGKINRDYQSFKRSSRFSRGLLAIGVILGLIGVATRPEFSTLIAMTTAVSVAITSYSNVNMYGKTYGLFQIASRELTLLSQKWLAKQNDPDLRDPAKRVEAERDFVEANEKILAEERESWYALTVNIQTISDGTIIAKEPKSD